MSQGTSDSVSPGVEKKVPTGRPRRKKVASSTPKSEVKALHDILPTDGTALAGLAKVVADLKTANAVDGDTVLREIRALIHSINRQTLSPDGWRTSDVLQEDLTRLIELKDGQLHTGTPPLALPWDRDQLAIISARNEILLDHLAAASVDAANGLTGIQFQIELTDSAALKTVSEFRHELVAGNVPLARVQELAQIALERLSRAVKVKGPRPHGDPVKRKLIAGLMVIYEKATGKPGTAGRLDDSDNRASGPFALFCQDIFHALGLTLSNNGFKQLVARLRKKARAAGFDLIGPHPKT